MQKWEYVIIQQNASNLNPGTFQVWEGQRTKLGGADDVVLWNTLTTLGGMGWEIISSHNKANFFVEYILKRPKEDK